MKGGGARRWMLKISECIAWVRWLIKLGHGEELELQSGGGGSVLGGAEKAGRRWVWANQWDDPAVNHTSDWESVGDARCLM